MHWVSCPVLWCRQNLLKLLLILATVSVVIRLILENQLQELQQKGLNPETSKGISQLYSHIKTMLKSERMDSFGTHRIIGGIYPVETVPTSVLAGDKVTLVSHCTPNHLHLVIDLARKWQGPISVAVFTPSELLVMSLKYLFYLYKCFNVYLHKTSLHFVTMYPDVPLHLPLLVEDFINIGEIVCESHQDFFKFSLTNYNLGSFKYPNNLLRNVAIRETVSDYLFVLDIDMIPSEHLSLYLNAFLAETNLTFNIKHDLEVFVVPAFEIDDSVDHLPLHKCDLLELWSRGAARSFYHEVCLKCHEPTNYDFWRGIQDIPNLGVSHEVSWMHPYEPFFIAPRSMPLFDERFAQYGFNRISQACELHMAGYTFSVLNNAFVIHRGFKNSNDFHSTKIEEQEENRKIFGQFKQELNVKYSQSNRRC